MSRFAVSCEHLAITAHFDEVILPSNPACKTDPLGGVIGAQI